MSNKVSILIVDDEIDVADIINFLLLDFIQIDLTTAISLSGNEAIKALSENTFDYCICDHNMPNGTGNKVLKFITEKNLKTKFILCSTVTPRSHPEEYPASQVFFNIEKPDVISGLEKLKDIVMKNYTMEENTVPPEEYHPIPSHYLDLFKSIPLDIYIKLGADHFVKLYSEGDVFTIDEKNKIREKTINSLFIKTDDSNRSVNEIIHETVLSIFNRTHLTLQEKMTKNFQELVDLVKFTGITPELAETIKASVLETAKLIDNQPDLQNAWKKLNLAGEFPAKLYCVQSLICGTILKKHSWNSEQTLFKLTLASFFQDLALNEISLMELYDYAEFLEKEDQFSRQNRSSYLAHPLKARELVEKISSIPPDIEKVVAEQHEAPEGLGFPRKTNACQLHPLSCLFIISGMVARYYLRNKDNFSQANLVNELERKGYKNGNFKDSFMAITQFPN